MSEAQDAIEALEQLGLTEYEARCFVALAQLPHGTAKDIGEVADIPRSRVYETMEHLQDRGLVELHDANPKQYQSVSIDTALRLLRAEYDSHLDTIEESFRQLEPEYKETVQGVWAIDGHDQVTGRVVDLIESADEEIVLLVLDEDLLDDDTLDTFAAAGDRNVSINIGTVSETIRDLVADAEVEASVFTTELIEWFTAMSGKLRLGRLLMVDRGPVLASALHEEELPGIPNETAVWSDGIDHGFATFAERVLTYELKENVEDVYEPVETE